MVKPTDRKPRARVGLVLAPALGWGPSYKQPWQEQADAEFVRSDSVCVDPSCASLQCNKIHEAKHDH